MNGLSWLILVAGVCDEIRTIAVLVFFLSAGATIGAALHWRYRIDFDGDREERSAKKTFSAALKGSIVAISIASAVVVLVPSKTTIYAIAASEMGEEVLKSSTATKAQKALDAWLDKQIGDEPTKDVEK